MAGKNLFVIVLEPGETKVFSQELSWLSVGASDPSLDAKFEIRGLAENNTDVLVCEKQAWTSPENALIQNSVSVKADANNTTNINITYRY